ncbi:Thymidylate_kinase [Hexamita inflata]|uniref:dTMP kinase n=1 Tax=Hexamita inflata TaxID=28002 RepID=A0AA86PGZ1_9EUKA|nr:Thymidylate kinase [Hexamita inflata]
MPGQFIVVEGLDRCGKDTQINLLLQSMPDAIKFNFPNEQLESGRKCRQYLLQQIQLTDFEINELYALNRRETMPEIVKLLNENKTVICSRYAFSGVAYTSAKGNMTLEEALQADKGILIPNITLFIYSEPKDIQQRFNGNDRYENVEFQEKVLNQFRQIKNHRGVGQWKEILVNKGIEETFKEVKQAIQECTETGVKYGLFE